MTYDGYEVIDRETGETNVLPFNACQILNVNLGRKLAEMEQDDLSLSRYVCMPFAREATRLDRVGVEFESNRPKYVLTLPPPSYRDIDNDCDGRMDGYKPSIINLEPQHVVNGQLFGHDGATADRPRQEENDYGLWRLDDVFDNDCDSGVDYGDKE